MQRSSAFLSLSIGLFAAYGCSADSAGDAEGGGGAGEGGAGGAPAPIVCVAPADPAVFEIGTGEACFERLADDAAITLWSGPQGGYHLFLAVGCADCGDAIVVRSSVLDPATSTPIDGTYVNAVFAELVDWGGWPQHAGIQVTMPGIQWDLENDPPLAEGTPIVLAVELLESDETTVIHEVQRSFVVGPTLAWDPCDLHPEGPCCSEDCI